jgi:ribosome biogenesis GTPase
MRQGRTLSIRGKYIHVLSQDEIVVCYLKNTFRQEKNNQKNSIAIGDLVWFNEMNQITKIEDRKTILQRMDPLNPRKRHVLGSNVDQVYITFAIKSPDINISMMDRYIMAAQKGGLIPVVIINKIDLLEDRSLINDLVNIYKNIGIEVLPISTVTNEGIKPLLDSLEGKISIFSGPSGAGKTSLINIIGTLDLKVGEISEKIQKGKHTTTYSSLIPLNKDTFIIDTPGVASFALFDVDQAEILSYFSDLNQPLGDCKYRGCSHTHEPFCKVKEAESLNLLSPFRLSSFRSMMENLSAKEILY